MSVPNQAGGNHIEAGRIAGIPVSFSPWYLGLVLLIYLRAGSVLNGTVVLICFTASVLFHELGHALVARHYGLRPAIVIHMFGGWCERAALSDRRKSLRIVAAGPAASVALALLAWVVLEILPTNTPGLLRFAVAVLAQTNLFWAVFNLLPVLPMDGGRMLQLQLGYHFNQGRADGLTYWIGAIFGGIGAILGWIGFQSLFIAVFLGFTAYQNVQRTAYHPFARTFRVLRNEIPAARGGSGFELPPTIAALFGALVGAAAASTATVKASSLHLVALVPGLVLDGHTPWTLLTAPFVHAPWQGATLAFGLIALAWFGPPVARALNDDRKFLALYVGSLWLGSVVALFAAGPLGHQQAYVFGPGAGSLALLVAWSRFVAPLPILPGLRLEPRHLAILVVGGDVLLGATGMVDWTWYAHLAGLVPGLLMPPQRHDDALHLSPPGKRDA